MSAPATGRADPSLVRALGTVALTASIVNVTIGGGIFRLPAGASQRLGAAAPLAYVACAVLMGLIVLCFAEAGSRVSLTGGLYAYVQVAFGRLVGFLTGWVLWLGVTAAVAAIATFFADAVGALVPALAPTGPRVALIVGTLALWAAINVAGVRAAGRFVVVMTIAKLVPLALLVVGGAFAVHRGNLAIGAAPSAGQLGAACVFLIFAFLGIESALVPGGEVRDPARTVPRSIFAAMGVVTVVYLLVQLVAQGILGASLAGAGQPLAAAAGVALGGWARALVLAGAAISMFGYVGGMTLAVPRMLFAFGRDGFLPAVGAVHSRFRTPHVAIVAQTLLVLALALSGKFETLALVANGASLIAYGACCLAVLELRRRDVRADGPPFRPRGTLLVPWLATAIIVWLLTSLDRPQWTALGVAVAAGAALYLVARLRAIPEPSPNSEAQA